MRRPLLRGLALATIAALALLASGCGGGSATTMSVVGGSELSDLEPLLPDIEKHTGIRLTFDFVGTLDGTEQIMSGHDRHELAWFSHSKYLDLLQQDAGTHYVKASQRIMLSPVIVGVKRSVAKRLGWASGGVTWRQIAEAAKAGKFRFAMTNPASSNSGFTALVGVAAAFAGTTDALNGGQVDTQAMTDLFSGQKLTAGSSGWLADEYVKSQDSLDGIVNYESVLMGLNSGRKLHEPLTLVYPKEGIITADYPLLLLDDAKREEYDKLTAYLRSPGFQEEITKSTLRRPAVPGVPADPRIPKGLLVELPFPSTAKTIDAILLAYLDQVRRPASATFVLDTSGSMADDDKIGRLRQALKNLAGADTSLTGRFAHFHEREQLTLLPFNNVVDPPVEFTIGKNEEATFKQIRAYANTLDADGGTAIFRALNEAYRLAADAQAAHPDRYFTIVLMTDGLNNEDQPTFEDFREMWNRLPPAAQKIRTFTVLFGDASPKEMERIADLTGGRVFDARSTSLSTVFKEIRGYQ